MMAAVGIGDGLAPIIGAHGSVHYRLLGRPKTAEGSVAVFVGTASGTILFLWALGFVQLPLGSLALVAATATAVCSIAYS